MPEGPEVWILSKAINEHYKNEFTRTGNKTVSIGKHLIINDVYEIWSFGLTGKVHINNLNELNKKQTGWVYGDQLKFTDYNDTIKDLGLDWMIASRKSLEEVVDKWIKSKQKLASLILDQSMIAGIGIAWGSEILFSAGVRPDIRACDQVLNTLVDEMIRVRKEVQELYKNELYKNELISNKLNVKEFINNWFSNLYDVRKMKIYKKGTKILVLGRGWWV